MPELLPTTSEQPNQSELAMLYSDATRWIQENCPLSLENADRNQDTVHYNGLPLLHAPAEHSMRITGEIVRTVIPDVVQTLRITDEDTVLVAYQPPFYERRLQAEPELCPGAFVIFLNKEHPDADNIIGWSAELESRPAQEWEMRPMFEYAGNASIANFDEWRASVTKVPPQIDYESYQAVRTIVDNLSALKQETEDRRLFMMLDPEMHRISRDLHHDLEAEAKLTSVVPALDIARIALLENYPETAHRFAYLDPDEVSAITQDLAQYFLTAEKTEAHLTAQQLEDFIPVLSELRAQVFHYQRKPAVEIMFTYQPIIEFLLRDIDRVNDIITMHKGSYTYRRQAYNLAGSLVIDKDIADEVPLEAEYRQFVSQLVSKLTREQ